MQNILKKEFNLKKILLLAATTSVLFAGADIEPLVDYDKQDVVQAVETVKEVKPAPAPVPVVCPTPVPVKPEGPKKWYVGLDGLGAQFETDSGKCNELAAVVAKLGYDFNKYIGIEGRIGYGINDSDHIAGGTTEIKENYGLYLKPMLPMGEKVHLFGLLGYAKAKVESKWNSRSTQGALEGTVDEASPSFGIGLNYAINDRWSIVAEGVRLLHKVDGTFKVKDGNPSTRSESDINLDTFGLGVNYRF
jgi:opacity protein-like surface antigen